MKKSTLYLLWAGLFIICAGLGFIPEPVGFPRFLLTALSIGFFVPPALLLHQAAKAKDAIIIVEKGSAGEALVAPVE